jgi:hypothetical protein
LYETAGGFYQDEFFPEGFAEHFQVGVDKDACMHFFQPHLMDDGIDGRGGKFIDEYGVIMMGIAINLFIELVAEE